MNDRFHFRPSGNFHLTTPREARGSTDDDIPLLLAHRPGLTSKPTGDCSPTSLRILLDPNIAKGKHMCSIRCMQQIVSKLNRDKLGVVIQPPLLCTRATLTLSIPFFHSAKLPVSSDSSNSAKPQSEVMMPSVGTCLFAGALAIWVMNLGPFSILLNQQWQKLYRSSGDWKWRVFYSRLGNLLSDRFALEGFILGFCITGKIKSE